MKRRRLSEGSYLKLQRLRLTVRKASFRIILFILTKFTHYHNNPIHPPTPNPLRVSYSCTGHPSTNLLRAVIGNVAFTPLTSRTISLDPESRGISDSRCATAVGDARRSSDGIGKHVQITTKCYLRIRAIAIK
jgi:hypothetical protein